MPSTRLRATRCGRTITPFHGLPAAIRIIPWRRDGCGRTQFRSPDFAVSEIRVAVSTIVARDPGLSFLNPGYESGAAQPHQHGVQMTHHHLPGCIDERVAPGDNSPVGLGA